MTSQLLNKRGSLARAVYKGFGNVKVKKEKMEELLNGREVSDSNKDKTLECEDISVLSGEEENTYSDVDMTETVTGKRNLDQTDSVTEAKTK